MFWINTAIITLIIIALAVGIFSPFLKGDKDEEI